MKVRVETDFCSGSGMCEGSVPEVFQIGIDGRAHVRCLEGSDAGDETVPLDLEDAVRDAETACPAGAIVVEG